MKNQIWKITRSLCAVFLSAGIAFALPPFAARADEITTEESTTAETSAEITTVETTEESTAATEETTTATEETTVATEETTVAIEETTTATEETTIATEETTTATEETTVATEETTVATEETTTATEETTIATEETTIATEETTIATEETTIATEESTIAMEETTIATEETTVATEEATTATEETAVATEETTTATEETTTAPPPISFFDNQPTAYVYNVTVEFGYFSFYYDFGVWDVTSFTYRASDSSNNPGATTTLGEPGWYGFDGVNNRVYIENNSPNGKKDILVTISFDNDMDEDGEAFPVDGVKMSLYARADEVNPLTESGETWSVPNSVYYDNNGEVKISPETVHLRKIEEINGKYSLYLPSGNDIMRSRTVYISLSGEPHTKDHEEELFFAATMTKLGFITVGISLVDGG